MTLETIDWSLLGTEPDSPGTRLGAAELVVLVGVTGVGKSTTLEALARRRPIRVLPDRRSLADRVILPAAQRLEGVRREPVTDRVERFRLTAVYRGRHPGGVAEALASIAVAPELLAGPPLIFDGLRGEDECRWAAHQIPGARFVSLDAPTAVRLERLLARRSAFDRVAAAAPEVDSVFDAVPGLEALVSAHELEAIVAASDGAGIDRGELARKAAILVAEARNYDPSAARRVLAELPSRRRLFVDTAAATPSQLAEAIATWLDNR